MKDGVTQVVIGGTLFTVPMWSQVLDTITSGAHIIAVYGGALIAINGLYRIVRNSRRQTKRKTDK